MFKSYIPHHYINDNNKYVSTIIDDEFEEYNFEKNFNSSLIRISLAYDIIITYEKRNLNVASNLIAGFRWFRQEYTSISMKDIIYFNKKENPLYEKYADDVEKYLMLM